MTVEDPARKNTMLVVKDTEGRWLLANRCDDRSVTNPYYVMTTIGWVPILKDPATGCDYPPMLQFPRLIKEQTAGLMGMPRPPLMSKNGVILHAKPGGDKCE